MTKRTLKIGTRGSKLALYQAYKVKEAIEEILTDITPEIVIINSKGDKILDVALSKIGDKGLFTKELEEALLRGEVDVAVHSLKDVPTHLPEGLIIGGVLPRGDVRDALISSKSIKLEDLTKRNDLVIATSSLRRTAHLLRLNPDLNIKDIRGNVNTRVKKMEDGYCDVMLMAAAGLQRLEMDEYISDTLDPEVVIPAVSQGAIAIQTRENDNFVSSVINQINHEQTFLATRAERIFLRMLEGGCQIPIGCYSKINGDNFSIKGFLSYIDGTEIIEETLTGKLEDADQLAEKLANIFIKAGAPEILARIRKANKS